MQLEIENNRKKYFLSKLVCVLIETIQNNKLSKFKLQIFNLAFWKYEYEHKNYILFNNTNDPLNIE